MSVRRQPVLLAKPSRKGSPMKHQIDPTDALSLLAQTGSLEDVLVREPLWLGAPPLADDAQEVHCTIDLRHSVFKQFNASFVFFQRAITVQDCEFLLCDFEATYFIGGGTFSRSRFMEGVRFCAGGHNAETCPLVFDKCSFEGFVDFNDCYYSGPIVFQNCSFAKGTNLMKYLNYPYGLANATLIVLDDNVGNLDLP
jgi:hypothetical protein